MGAPPLLLRALRAATSRRGVIVGVSILSASSVAALCEGGAFENWSGTKRVHARRVLQPESEADVLAAVKKAGEKGHHVSVVGSALSPNGLCFSEDTMLSMSLCDRILSVDPVAQQVTLEAGVRVREVAATLRKHGMTLSNYASILDQQIGGFMSVGAHGTGVTIAPVDEQIVRMRLVTPGHGIVELSDVSHPKLFRLAKVGLGAFGVVTELTLQCVPAYKLRETVRVCSREDVHRNHSKILLGHKHVKYLWIPHTDAVVVFTYDEADGPVTTESSKQKLQDALAPMSQLLRFLAPDQTECGDSLPALRDDLLSLDPLNLKHVIRVNRAEAECWRRLAGSRVAWSDECLNFDCGGQQWVSEVALPTGTRERLSGADLEFMGKKLEIIESMGIPAPAPIEQRWTARSTAALSPAHSADPDAVFSWVGIIMYLPTDDGSPNVMRQRNAITNAFEKYRATMQQQLWSKYGAHEHWGKLEPSWWEPKALEAHLRSRYPVDEVGRARTILDPKGIIRNPFVDACFPRRMVRSRK